MLLKRVVSIEATQALSDVLLEANREISKIKFSYKKSHIDWLHLYIQLLSQISKSIQKLVCLNTGKLQIVLFCHNGDSLMGELESGHIPGIDWEGFEKLNTYLNQEIELMAYRKSTFYQDRYMHAKLFVRESPVFKKNELASTKLFITFDSKNDSQ